MLVIQYQSCVNEAQRDDHHSWQLCTAQCTVHVWWHTFHLLPADVFHSWEMLPSLLRHSEFEEEKSTVWKLRVVVDRYLHTGKGSLHVLACWQGVTACTCTLARGHLHVLTSTLFVPGHEGDWQAALSYVEQTTASGIEHKWLNVGVRKQLQELLQKNSQPLPWNPQVGSLKLYGACWKKESLPTLEAHERWSRLQSLHHAKETRLCM